MGSCTSVPIPTCTQLLEIGSVKEFQEVWRKDEWTSNTIPDVLVTLTLQYVTHVWFDDCGKSIFAHIARDLWSSRREHWPSSRIEGYRSPQGRNVMDQWLCYPAENMIPTVWMMQLGTSLDLNYYRTETSPTILHAFSQRPKRFKDQIQSVLYYSRVSLQEMRSCQSLAIARVETERNDEVTDPFGARYFSLDQDQGFVRHQFEIIELNAGKTRPFSYEVPVFRRDMQVFRPLTATRDSAPPLNPP